MDWFVSITAEQWTAAGTWATVVVALVAATVGLRQVREARRLREDQAQPYVVAIMEQNLTAPSIIEIAFRNYGTTAARNIHVMSCLLYTSDAADDLTRVDLGGRRII